MSKRDLGASAGRWTAILLLAAAPLVPGILLGLVLFMVLR